MARWKKYSLISILSLIALLLLSMLVVPWQIKKQGSAWIAENTSRQLHFGKVFFNPFTLTVELEATRLTEQNSEETFVGLQRLMEEDPTLRVTRSEETKEMVLSGMGQIHLEVAVERLKRKFGAEVVLKEPKVPYRETIRGSVKVQGKYKKQSGGRGQFGDVWIEMEPLPRGEGYEFVDKIVGGVIPRNYIPAVDKGIQEAMQHGLLTKNQVVDVRIILYDGSHHSVDSSEMAFKVAGSMAFKKAMEQCKPTLLEPIMAMEVTVPDDCMGDVIGDLNSRRGRVIGVEPQANSQLIKAEVPMAEVLRYAPELRSMTSDRGMFTMEFSKYEEVPSHQTAKILEEYAAES